MKPQTAKRPGPFLLLTCLIAIFLTTPARALAQTTHDVTVGDNFFSPSFLEITVGDTVRWTNAPGGVFHDVTANDGSFSSETATSFTFEWTFNSVEEVDYFCTVHPNTMQGVVNVVQGGVSGVDLSLEEVSSPSGVFAPGDPVSIGIEIMNIGSQASGNFSITYYASTNAVITETDTELGSDNQNGLDPGEDLSYTAAAVFPVDMEDGVYYIGGIIDIDDANDDNNVNLDDEPLTVATEATTADLSLNWVNAPSGDVEQGQNILVRTQTENIGNQMSNIYRITYYASEDNIITDDDTPIGFENRDGLFPGENHTGSFSTMIPTDLALGDYFIGAILDIADANENNNVNHDNTGLTVVLPQGQVAMNAGLNGNWWNGPARNGEGVQVEIADGGAAAQTAARTEALNNHLVFVGTIYSYDTMGNQIFLVAVGPVDEDTAEVDVFITEGGMWGQEYDPDLVTEIQWGTGTFIASSCDAMQMELRPNAQFQGMGYTNLMYDLIRLTTPSAPCPSPVTN